MKKINIIAAAIIAGTLSASAFAEDGQVNFIGSITGESCTLTNNTTNPLNVTLGNVAQSSFTGKGVTSSPTNFVIALTNCPKSALTAKVKFGGTAHPDDSELLGLTDETDVATGVGVLISDASNAVVPLNTASAPYKLVEGANNLTFTARYRATVATVTAGPANSVANFTINYN